MCICICKSVQEDVAMKWNYFKLKNSKNVKVRRGRDIFCIVLMVVAVRECEMDDVVGF